MAVTQTMPREEARYATAIPAYIAHLLLSLLGGEVVFTIPAACRFIRIETDADLHFSSTTAEIPVGNVTDGTGSGLMAAGSHRFFRVRPAEAISFIAGQETNVAIECYEGTFESLGV